MTHDRAPGVTILHISDTQFGQHHRFTDDDSLSSSLIRDLELLAADGIPSVDLVMLSGDIAETGRRREYEQARAFVDAVLEHTALPPDRLVLVPGNHDVSWSLCQAYFNECDDEQVEPREPYPKKWRNYRDFVVDLHGPTGFTEEQPYRVHRFPELRVVVAGLNSTIQESHQDQDHFGWCGTSQLRWFAEQLREGVDSLRVGVVHHNVRRKADADNENLRDEDDLTRILGPQLDLLLHGHTHEGKQDRLSDGTPVLATGSAAVTSDWRPGEVPNQYQIIQVTPGSLTRWTRQWAPERKEWIGDLRASAAGDAWTVKQGLNTPGWQQTTPTAPEPKHAREWRDLLVDGQVRFGRLEEDFTNQVERVTRFQFDEATIDRRRKAPDLQYLLVATPNAPLRCVAVVDGQLDADLLRRFESEVFDPLRSRQGEFVVVHHGSDDPRLRVDAARRGIRVKTWLEYNNLLELSAYRTWLMADLEQDSLYPQALYQPQRFHGIDRFGRLSGSERDDLLGEVYDAILEEDGRFLLVLGDAGFGKSFLVRRLAKEMLDNERVNITPIVIYLRDRDKQQTLDEMVASVLIPSRASFHADRFRHSLQNGTLALLVDGYDEFAVRVGYESAASQLRTFVDAMQGRAKLLLTTRPSHFRSTDEVTTKLFASLHTVHDGRVYQLQPFNEPQQQAFLTRWFELRDEQDPPARANEWMRALAEVDNLPELQRLNGQG